MKFVEDLDETLIEYLNDLIKTSASHRTRQRAHAILLSYKKYTIEAIADIFDSHRDTISRWVNSWHEKGIQGLYDAPKPGRPRIREPKVSDIKTLNRIRPIARVRRIRERLI